jgi:hypothetical protein
LDEAAPGMRGGCEESFWEGIGDAMGQGEVSLKVSLVVWASGLWQGDQTKQERYYYYIRDHHICVHCNILFSTVALLKSHVRKTKCSLPWDGCGPRGAVWPLDMLEQFRQH